MGLGKFLGILAGILTIIGTYIIAFIGFNGTTVTGSGIGFFQNLGDAWSNPNSVAALLGGVWIVYLLIIVMFFFVISGFLQLLGANINAIIGIFSIFPLAIGLLFMFNASGAINSNHVYYMMLLTENNQIIENFPVILEINNGMALGTVLVIAGGVMGLFSAIIPREDTY